MPCPRAFLSLNAICGNSWPPTALLRLITCSRILPLPKYTFLCKSKHRNTSKIAKDLVGILDPEFWDLNRIFGILREMCSINLQN